MYEHAYAVNELFSSDNTNNIEYIELFLVIFIIIPHIIIQILVF
jgi:hypothetical protein